MFIKTLATSKRSRIENSLLPAPTDAPAGDLPDGGFTLIEILIGLAVLGLLLAGLAQGLHYGFRVWDAQGATIARRDRLDAVDRALRQLIGQADAGEQDGPAPFVGGPERFAFITRLPAQLSTISRKADAVLLVDNSRLVLRWTPHLHATRLGPPRAPTDTELLAGVEKVEFRYWKAAGGGGPAGWQSTWRNREPPELVKIHFVFPPGDPRRWPDIVAALEREPDAT